jgi:hypothetical protein
MLDRAEEWLASWCTCKDPNSFCRVLCMVVVALVTALISMIGILGTYPVLHDLCTGRALFLINVSLAILLELNILFNYFAAVLRNPGEVREFYDITTVPPSRQSFDNFTYCEKCARSMALLAHCCSQLTAFCRQEEELRC